MKSIQEFEKMKSDGKKISIVTCYDYTLARILDDSDIDAVLVGDSAAMVMHGFETTINAEVEMMCYHIAAVKRGTKNKLIIADLPFLSHKKGIEHLTESIDRMMKAGAQAVKLEGANDNLVTIKYLVDAGIPVMGHLGLTPQSVNQFGGYRLQGKEKSAAENILIDAHSLEGAGCFSIVLELIPSELAKKITDEINIPTIGIGAGKFTCGQVLVLQDLLGLTDGFNPKFLRKYLNGAELIKHAVNHFNKDIKEKKYPGVKESY
jgi:3-methyl-2-oxobutanoate hydroxymethyltransferase